MSAQGPCFDEECSDHSSEPPSSDDGIEGTLLEAWIEAEAKVARWRHGVELQVFGSDGRAFLKVYLDLERPGRLVIVLQTIVVKKQHRRAGVATQFLRSVATIFRAKPTFSSVKVESVLTLAMAALCRKEGMTTTDGSDFYMLL